MVFFLAPAVALAEQITYELYDISNPGQRILLAKGVKEYTLKEVLVERNVPVLAPNWSKEIPIAEGFHAQNRRLPRRLRVP